MPNHISQRHWSLLILNADTLVIRDEAAQTQTVLMSEIAGFGITLRAQNGASGRVDVILHNGDRYRIGSPRAHDLARALDARLG